jgi:hypothetical protein
MKTGIPPYRKRFWWYSKLDELVKSHKTVMPDLIRHPEAFEIAGF